MYSWLVYLYCLILNVRGDIPEAKPVSEAHIGMCHDSLFM
jgi:hypothetical protein